MDATPQYPLRGRSVIVTGAGRGLGRAHALLMAQLGAHVVVNDAGVAIDGSGANRGPATAVVVEIEAGGGTAVASTDDVSTTAGAESVVQLALDTFGGLDVLVNNAGILREGPIVDMSDEAWDDVIRVHLRGTFGPTRAAARYWRSESEARRQRAASIITTGSVSGLIGMVGHSSYGAAKAGVLMFTLIAAGELEAYGVRVNAVCPSARTRLAEAAMGLSARLTSPSDGFDPLEPANVASLVAYLAHADCPLSGEVFSAGAGRVAIHRGWTVLQSVPQTGQLSIPEVEQLVSKLPFGQSQLLTK